MSQGNDPPSQRGHFYVRCLSRVGSDDRDGLFLFFPVVDEAVRDVDVPLLALLPGIPVDPLLLECSAHLVAVHLVGESPGFERRLALHPLEELVIVDRLGGLLAVLAEVHPVPVIGMPEPEEPVQLLLERLPREGTLELEPVPDAAPVRSLDRHGPVPVHVQRYDLDLDVTVDDALWAQVYQQGSRPGGPAVILILERVHVLERYILDDLVHHVTATEYEDRYKSQDNRSLAHYESSSLRYTSFVDNS